MSIIERINNEYFGKDPKKRYLKNDFSIVLRGIIVKTILVELFLELSKSRHSQKKLSNRVTFFGDFDPDNAGLFSNIFEFYQKGWMISVRQFLTPREQGTGGKFITDIKNLTIDNFMEFYINGDHVCVPPLLYSEILTKEKSKKYSDLILSHRNYIKETVNILKNKAEEFQNKNYYREIITDYQALEFHKDSYSDKYDVSREDMDLPFINGIKLIKRPRSSIEVRKITKSLNEFAEIATVYQSLVGQNTSFCRPELELRVFIDRTLALFVKKVPDETKERIFKDIVKHFKESLSIVCWRY